MVTPTQARLPFCLVLLLKVLQMKKATFWGSLIFQKLKYELNWCYSANVTAAIYPVSLIRVVAHGNADTGEIALCLVLLLKVLQMKKATFWGSLIFQKLKYELNWCDSAIVTAAWREQSRGSHRNYKSVLSVWCTIVVGDTVGNWKRCNRAVHEAFIETPCWQI